MNTVSATPVFIDTGAFYARADQNDTHHEETIRFFNGIQTGKLSYRPIFTSQAVLSEFATLALYKLGHDTATRALTAIRNSDSVNIVPASKSAFETATEQFVDYDDQDISFVDHTSSVLADTHDIEHIFAFDSDFRTLGFSLVPDDIDLPER
ncbi:type II toxin-antitoxin system VapC family toxin [Halorubrum sp. CSM-61]|uniref:type II toxin-antitoxin system VapC family toxin n=1 Tax=Halorubrum sp. CSM-61 TaxID=2485838 RepID=UPI000F4CEFDB|nr:PIN domain-containing protein [Halorubrum sp. CSM-61]